MLEVTMKLEFSLWIVINSKLKIRLWIGVTDIFKIDDIAIMTKIEKNSRIKKVAN